MNDRPNNDERLKADSAFGSLEAELKALRPRAVAFDFSDRATQELDLTKTRDRFTRRQVVVGVLISAAAACLTLIYWLKLAGEPTPSTPRNVVVAPMPTEPEVGDERQISIAAYSREFAKSTDSLESLLVRQAEQFSATADRESVATAAGNIVELK